MSKFSLSTLINHNPQTLSLLAQLAAEAVSAATWASPEHAAIATIGVAALQATAQDAANKSGTSHTRALIVPLALEALVAEMIHIFNHPATQASAGGSSGASAPVVVKTPEAVAEPAPMIIQTQPAETTAPPQLGASSHPDAPQLSAVQASMLEPATDTTMIGLGQVGQAADQSKPDPEATVANQPAEADHERPFVSELPEPPAVQQ